MKRVPTFVLTITLASIGAASAFARDDDAAGDPPARPNLLFFLADDLRFDQLGYAGHPHLRTPNVDRLAAQGVRFDNAFVTTSICAASRASILTGLPERTTGYTFGRGQLAEHLVDESYPALLRQAGYRVGLVGKLGVNISKAGREKMFDVLHSFGRGPYFKKTADGGTRHATQITADKAIEFLENQPAEEPFCLSLSFNAPHAEDHDKEDHYPWPRVVDGWYEQITPAPPRLGDPAIFDAQPEFLRTSMNRDRWFWRWDTEEKWRRNVRGYWRMISGVDHAVGRVLEELRQRGLDERTVVIFCSDNGYYLGDRGFAGKWSHYEESLRIPMVIHDPRRDGAEPSLRVRDMVLNLDVTATLLDLAGVPVPERMVGRSLAPYLRGEPPRPWREDFFCEHLFDNASIPKWEGVREQRWVYARYFEQSPAFEFLHDLEQDPDQLVNLAAQPDHRDALLRLRARCDELRDAHAAAARR